MELGYSLPELAAAQQVGRPIDTQKYEGIKLKFQMDTDEMVYVGDADLGVPGLVNSDAVTPENVTTKWSDASATPEMILDDINGLIDAVWKQSGYAVCPTHLLVPPAAMAKLVKPSQLRAASRSFSMSGKNALHFRSTGVRLRSTLSNGFPPSVRRAPAAWSRTRKTPCTSGFRWCRSRVRRLNTGVSTSSPPITESSEKSSSSTPKPWAMPTASCRSADMKRIYVDKPFRLRTSDGVREFGKGAHSVDDAHGGSLGHEGMAWLKAGTASPSPDPTVSKKRPFRRKTCGR